MPFLPRRSRYLLAAGLLFTLSGALGLGYQLVWVKKATLVVGTSQIALSTVLTSFFIGLALGSLVVGRRLRSDRISPLFVYGLFEAGIGAYALAFPFLFGLAEECYSLLYPLAAGNAQPLFFLRFGLLFLLFIVPTFFMGGTLPLLLDGLVERDRSIGSMTGFLYGLNIVGAVLGVLIASYFAIPGLGVNRTNLAAGLGNLSIAIAAIVLFRKTPPLHPRIERKRSRERLGLFFPTFAFVSGLASIGYQIGWARYFSLFKTASVHLTAVLLAVFLAALAAGSFLVAKLLSRGARPLRVVALTQPLAAILALYGLGLWKYADFRFVGQGFDVHPSWRLLGETIDATFLAPLFQVALVVFVPVTLMGTALPGIIAAATRRSFELRETSGSLLFANTVGASAGGFATGYLLIPALGLTGTFFALSLLTLALGAAAECGLVMEERRLHTGTPAKGDRRRARQRAGRLPLGPAHLPCAVVLVLAVFFLGGDITREAVRKYGPGSRLPDAELVDLVEGPLTTGSIFANPRNLYIAAGDQILAVVRKGDISVQVVEGYLPILFYPRPGVPKRVLGIAVGSGQSFGAMLRYPIEKMDVVDISSEMIELAMRHFRTYNNELIEDERVSVHLDDGRHFVERAEPESYDVVSMEPPPPTEPGVHALYSLEFYRAIERVLHEDGVLLQWVPLYWLTPNEARGVIKTVAEVFPWTFVVRMGQIDFVTLSFKRSTPPRWSINWIKERAEVFATEKLLFGKRWTSHCKYETASLEGILALLTCDPEDIARMEAHYIYVDDDQRLSYSSGDRHLLRRYHGTVLPVLTFPAIPLTPFDRFQRYFVDSIPARAIAEERARALALYHVPSPADVEAAVSRYKEARAPSLRATAALDAARLLGYSFERSLPWVERAIRADPSRRSQWLADWAAFHAHVHRIEIRLWLESLPQPLRSSPATQGIRLQLKRTP